MINLARTLFYQSIAVLFADKTWFILPYLDNSMAEIRTVTTLRSKRTEIIASIANYEKKFAQARADLAHMTAAITIFEASCEPEEIPPYVDIHRCFRRGETIAICKEALAQGPLNSRQLALKVTHGRERS